GFGQSGGENVRGLLADAVVHAVEQKAGAGAGFVAEAGDGHFAFESLEIGLLQRGTDLLLRDRQAVDRWLGDGGTASSQQRNRQDGSGSDHVNSLWLNEMMEIPQCKTVAVHIRSCNRPSFQCQ